VKTSHKLIGLRWLLGILAVALLAVAAACGDDEEAGGGGAQQQFDGEIKIGNLADLSGPGLAASATTLSHQVAMQSAMDEINADGGVTVAGKKYKLVQVIVDTKSDPVQAVAGAQQLLQEGVLAVYNSTTFGGVPAYQQMKDKVITYSTNPGLTYLIDAPVEIPGGGVANNPLMFSNIDGFLPIVVGHIAMAKNVYPDIKSVGIVTTNLPIGFQLASAMEVAAKQLGLTYAGSELVPLGATDIAPSITNMKAKNPDFVFFVTIIPSIIQTLDAALAGDLAKYYGVWTLRPIEIKKQLRDIGDSVLISPDWRLPLHDGLVPDKYKDAVERLGELPGGEPRFTGWAISQWDWIFLLKQAIEQANSLDVNAIAAALRTQKYDGPFGLTEVLAKNQTTSGTTGMMVKVGDTYTVYGWTDLDSAIADKEPLFKISAKETDVEPQ